MSSSLSSMCMTTVSARLNAIRLHLNPSSPSYSSILHRSFSSSPPSFKETDVVILSAVRTPIGSFQGALSSLSAVDLGVVAVSESLKRAKVRPDQVSDVILGNVVGANVGQAPSTQVSFKAGLPFSCPSTTINKVCASGMKTLMFASQTIHSGHNEVVVSGGFESMSNIPFYLPKVRQGIPLGHSQMVDGLLRDGLTDAFDDHHMGMCGEACAAEFGFTRQDQDKYALESYRKAQSAIKEGLFKDEIISVRVRSRKGEDIVVSEDEEPSRLNAAKLSQLKPAFKPNGTITAANASKLNDGAAALVIASGAFARKNGLTPLAKIVGYADAQRKPIEFPTAPALAIPKALKHAGLKVADIDFWEINEAFSSVNLANNKLLGLDPSKVNVNGGAVALGHPIGSSGARIIVTLIHILKNRKAKYGCAAICNGGGGASAIVVQNL